jgi:hypothetical protein
MSKWAADSHLAAANGQRIGRALAVLLRNAGAASHVPSFGEGSAQACIHGFAR